MDYWQRPCCELSIAADYVAEVMTQASKIGACGEGAFKHKAFK
jgi:hypothetical protein